MLTQNKFIKLFEAYGCSEMEIPLHFSWLVLPLWLGWCLTNHFGHSVVSGAWNITTKSDTSGESRARSPGMGLLLVFKGSLDKWQPNPLPLAGGKSQK